MHIVQFTRLKGGKHDDMVKIAKKAKSIIEKHGAEFMRLSRFHTGAWAGEWLVTSRYPNWSTYGKAQEALAKDADWQKVMAQVGEIAEVTARNLAVGIDI